MGSAELNRANWRTWRFDQMAVNVNDRIDNPAEADVDHYVGLEHLDSDSLKIRRWGSPTDVEATKLRFRKGDIIFGRRRAYQRKLGVAEFDGICSAHAMVLRARPDVVLPEFLPFFMHSDLFMSRAVEISVGSLSPTINWKTLAEQEFALPPLEEQRQVVVKLEPLLRMQTAVQDAHDSAAVLLEALRNRLTSAHLGNSCIEKPVEPQQPSRLIKLGDALLVTQYGISTVPKTTGKYPLLRMTDIVNGEVTENDVKYTDVSDDEFRRYRVMPGDVLFNRTNSIDLVGRNGVYRLNGNHVFASYLIRLRTRPDLLLPDYLVAFLNSSIGQKQIRAIATKGVSQANVNATNLANMTLPLPGFEEQQHIVEQLKNVKESIDSLSVRCQEAIDLYKSGLSQLTGPH